MGVNIIDSFSDKIEDRGEDLIIIALIFFSIAMFIGAFAAFKAEISNTARQEASMLAESIPEYSFFQRLDYLGSVFFPWIIMFSSMVIAREVWLYRRKLRREEKGS